MKISSTFTLSPNKIHTMSVYKELGYLVNQIQKQSRMIWNEFAYFGMPIESYNDPIIKWVKSVMDQYNVPVKSTKYGVGFTQTFEFDGGIGCAMENGFMKVKIDFHSTSKGPHKGYLSVQTWNDHLKEYQYQDF